jgi:hypothetical protein
VETFQEEIYGWGKVIYSRETLRKMPNPFFTLTRSAKATLGFLGREPLNGQTTVQVSNLEMVEAVMRLGAEAFMKEGSSSRSLSGHWENRTRALINWEMKESFPDQQGAYIATTALREMRDILQEIVENNPNEDLDFVLEAGLKTWKSAKVIDKILQRVVTEDLCPKRWEQIPADSLSKLQGATVKEAVASLWRENVLKDLSKMFKKGAEAISNVAHNGPWEPVMVEYSTWSDSELLSALTHTRPHLVMNASSSLVQVPNVLLPLTRGARAGGAKALEVKVPWINQTDFERIAELAEAMGERKDDWVDVNFQDAVDAWLLINDKTI